MRYQGGYKLVTKQKHARCFRARFGSLRNDPAIKAMCSGGKSPLGVGPGEVGGPMIIELELVVVSPALFLNCT